MVTRYDVLLHLALTMTPPFALQMDMWRRRGVPPQSHYMLLVAIADVADHRVAVVPASFCGGTVWKERPEPSGACAVAGLRATLLR